MIYQLRFDTETEMRTFLDANFPAGEDGQDTPRQQSDGSCAVIVGAGGVIHKITGVDEHGEDITEALDGWHCDILTMTPLDVTEWAVHPNNPQHRFGQ
jgi:hypothetical protein